MAFKAPALYTTISRTEYETQLNSNFAKIQQALTAIQNEFAAITGVNVGSSGATLAYTGILTKPDAVIGINAFVPVFSMDTDGNWTVQITRTTADGTQNAIISSLLHTMGTSDQPTFDVTAQAPVGEQEEHRMIIGLKSDGAPAMHVVVDYSPDSTDEADEDLVDLVVWQFMYKRTTDGDIIYDLERVAPVYMDGQTQTEILEKEDTLMVDTHELINDDFFTTGGDSGHHIIVPYDCEVIGAAAVMGERPTDGETVEAKLVRDFDGVAEVITDGTWIYQGGTDEDQVVELDIKADPPCFLKANELVTLVFDQVEAVTDARARDFRAQLRVRKVNQEIRREGDQ